MKIIVVGKIKEAYFRNKITEYVESIQKKNKIDIIELADESIPKNAGESQIQGIKEKEGMRILEYINNNDYVIALCIEGKLTDSEGLKKLCEKVKSQINKDIVFVIGGSLGLDEKVVRRADYKLSFSKMTFPHQLMRVMLLEQIATYL